MKRTTPIESYTAHANMKAVLLCCYATKYDQNISRCFTFEDVKETLKDWVGLMRGMYLATGP